MKQIEFFKMVFESSRERCKKMQAKNDHAQKNDPKPNAHFLDDYRCYCCILSVSVHVTEAFSLNYRIRAILSGAPLENVALRECKLFELTHP